jgi:hypothetical protein
MSPAISRGGDLALGVLIAVSLLAACTGSSHERAVSTGEVKAALRSADLHFEVLPTGRRVPSAIEVFGPPLDNPHAIWMGIRVFPTVRAAMRSQLIVIARREFPAEHGLDLIVCNVWLSPEAIAGPPSKLKHSIN